MSRRVTRPARWLPTAALALAALVLAALAGVPVRAGAQPAVPNDGQSRILLAAGLDGYLRDGSAFTPALAVHAGYEFGRGGVLGRLGLGPRLGLRLGADYTTRRYTQTTLRFNGDPALTIDRAGRSQLFGAILLATYALTDGPARLYTLGGAGLYGLTGVQREPASPVAPAGTSRTTRVSPALSGGLGASGRLAGVGVFGEARVTYLPNGLGGSRPGVRGVVVPLVVGVRF